MSSFAATGGGMGGGGGIDFETIRRVGAEHKRKKAEKAAARDGLTAEEVAKRPGGQLGKRFGKFEAEQRRLGIQDRVAAAGDLSRQQIDEFARGEAPMLDPTQQAQFREQQLALMQQLSNQAQGLGPSLAEMQLREGEERQRQALASQIASTRGVNPAVAARLIAQQGAASMQDVNRGAAQLRLQEQMQAQQALAGLSGQGRAQDIGMAGANQTAQLQQQGLNNALIQQLLGQQFGAQTLGAQMSQQQMLAAAGQAQQIRAADAARNSQLMGAGIGALGTLGAAGIGLAAGGPAGAAMGAGAAQRLRV